ncbi:phosphotransferase [Streptomyces sannanensis]|uniref:Phosphotransferase n=2 Tax=Streptomyces sannanensis TaxID=285536 RepID=A0ABP6SBK2_9ACTN
MALSRAGGEVVGPLKGYHHEAYVFAPAAVPTFDASLLRRIERVKLRERRPGVESFDRRCFTSEDELLAALQGRVRRIPEVVEVDGVPLHGFVEGRTLADRCPPGTPLAARHLGQLMTLFRELAVISPDELPADRIRTAGDGADDHDTTAFLRCLVRFTEEHVRRRNTARFGTLFDALGIRPDALPRFAAGLPAFTRRPFSLLHGDLHRENFVVDARGDLWTIDWELAMVGDPLYDLATHLYLMRYPRGQASRVATRWRDAMESVRPGSAAGWAHDLPHILAYKRAQSVYTDVIRAGLVLREGGVTQWQLLPRVARRIHGVLESAAGPLGLAEVPGQWQIVSAYAVWLRTEL